MVVCDILNATHNEVIDQALQNKAFVSKFDLKSDEQCGHLCVANIAIIFEGINQKRPAHKNLALAEYLKQKYPGSLNYKDGIKALQDAFKFLKLKPKFLDPEKNKILKGVPVKEEKNLHVVSDFTQNDLDVLKNGSGLLYLGGVLLDENNNNIAEHAMVATRIKDDIVTVLDPSLPTELLRYRLVPSTLTVDGNKAKTFELHPMGFELTGKDNLKGKNWSLFQIWPVSMDYD